VRENETIRPNCVPAMGTYLPKKYKRKVFCSRPHQDSRKLIIILCVLYPSKTQKFQISRVTYHGDTSHFFGIGISRYQIQPVSVFFGRHRSPLFVYYPPFPPPFFSKRGLELLKKGAIAPLLRKKGATAPFLIRMYRPSFLELYLFIGHICGRNFVHSLPLKWVPMFLAIFFLLLNSHVCR